MVKKLQVFEAPSITVSFDPNVCRHSGVCVRTLPAASALLILVLGLAMTVRSIPPLV